MYRDGMKTTRIGEKFGINRAVVRARLIRAGVWVCRQKPSPEPSRCRIEAAGLRLPCQLLRESLE